MKFSYSKTWKLIAAVILIQIAEVATCLAGLESGERVRTISKPNNSIAVGDLPPDILLSCLKWANSHDIASLIPAGREEEKAFLKKLCRDYSNQLIMGQNQLRDRQFARVALALHRNGYVQPQELSALIKGVVSGAPDSYELLKKVLGPRSVKEAAQALKQIDSDMARESGGARTQSVRAETKFLQ